MARACHLAVNMATGGAFSEQEIDALMERLASKAKTQGRVLDAEAIQKAAQELTREELLTAAIERRLEVAAARARKARGKLLDGLPGDEADRLRAYNVGTEKQGFGSALSVDGEGRARTVELWTFVEKGLRDAGLMDRLSDFWGKGDKSFERKVAREMARLNGGVETATGDAEAAAAAEVFVEALERGRLKQNDQGAWIGKLEGYIVRQGHDRMKVSGGFWRELKAAGFKAVVDWKGARRTAAEKAYREWRDFILPKLDERTFDGLTPEDVNLDGEVGDIIAAAEAAADDVREKFLRRVWFDIITGRHEVLNGAGDLGEFRPPASKARSVSKSRVLHFKGADAWMDYHERFGSGSLFGAVMGDLERAAKNSALMARWGPAPDAAFEAELARLESAARARGDEAAAAGLHARQRRAEFGELTGENNRPESLRLAVVGRTIRLDQSLSKLGGMVLSAMSDTSLSAQAFKRAGGSFLEGYEGAWRGVLRMQSEEGKRAADLLDVGARSAAQTLATRFSATDGPAGWGAWAQKLFYRINLFEWWSDGLRRGVAEMLAAHLGEQSRFGWDGLNIGTRETLERYGIDAAAWELSRRGVTAMPDGRSYFSFDQLDDISDQELWKWAGLKGKARTPEAARRVREDLALRFQALVHGTLDDAMTEARAREKVGVTRGIKPGTIAGESIRLFTQFWSFSSAVMGRHVAPAARGYAGAQPVALLAHLIVASTLMGFASLQAKQLVKGRTPRDARDPETWIAALLQGGGLGIYGDWLFGEANRNGMSFTLSAMAGPAVSELERVAGVVRRAVRGDVDDLPADLIQIGKSNTPLINLWYTRLALDYLVLWRLQEAVSPGYLERYEKRVEESEGSQFFISPSEALQ